eukprot:COSAG06_NODE_97_length_24284_cov_6.792270_15_plen_1556_part_00
MGSNSEQGPEGTTAAGAVATTPAALARSTSGPRRPPPAASRTFTLLVVPNECCSVPTKITCQASTLGDLIGAVRRRLGLDNESVKHVLSLAVKEGSGWQPPVQLTALSAVPTKGKVQLWPLVRFGASVSAGGDKQDVLGSPVDGMNQWASDRAADWVSLVLGLEESTAVHLRAEFSAKDIEGDGLMGNMKRVQRVLAQLLVDTDASEAVETLCAERDGFRSSRLLGNTSAKPAEIKWGPIMAGLAPARKIALQGALDSWQTGRWTVADPLGAGGSGVVFAAKDSRLGQVAVKFTCAGEDLRKAEREAALMQRVAHEHVCRLFEHNTISGGLCIMVMELLNKGSLEERISKEQRIREFEVVKMGFDVLSALAFIHDKGVIHRDVKPSNIMLTWVEGRLLYKLIDMSVSAMQLAAQEDVSSTMATGATGLRAVVGTPHYMSPEQFLADEVVTQQTDLWSLGAVIFESLSGVKPFAPVEADDHKISYAIVNTEAPMLPDVIEEVGVVGDNMAAFVSHSLRKDLSARFKTAEAMNEALEQTLSAGRAEGFALFISYRVWCDKEFAQALFRATSATQLRPGREHRMQVYLDQVRLLDGDRFDVGFIKGLASSTVFTPLLSTSCLGSFLELETTDKEDFVLMEWIVAIQLHKLGVVKAIFPIVMGEQKDDGKFEQFFFEQLRDGKVKGKPLPDIVSKKTTDKAREFLGMLDPPVELTLPSAELSVKAVVDTILKFQAVLLHFENEKLVNLRNSHGKSQQLIARDTVAKVCAERIAKVVKEKQPAPELPVEPEPEPGPESAPQLTRSGSNSVADVLKVGMRNTLAQPLLPGQPDSQLKRAKYCKCCQCLACIVIICVGLSLLGAADVQCGAHGSVWRFGSGRFGSCNCEEGYSGERCENVSTDGLPPAYVVTGSMDTTPNVNGRYVRTEAICNNKPVYEREEEPVLALLQGTGRTSWYITSLSSVATCSTSGFVYGPDDRCPADPGASSCDGTWQQNTPSGATCGDVGDPNTQQHGEWCPNPSLHIKADFPVGTTCASDTKPESRPNAVACFLRKNVNLPKCNTSAQHYTLHTHGTYALWTSHPHTNCWGSADDHGADSVAGRADPFCTTDTIDACRDACTREAGCTAVITYAGGLQPQPEPEPEPEEDPQCTRPYETVGDNHRGVDNYQSNMVDPHVHSDVRADAGCSGEHDASLDTGVGGDRWYRFSDELEHQGDALPLRSPGPYHCGTTIVGWLSGWVDPGPPSPGDPPADFNEPGSYPLLTDGVVDKTVCFDHPLTLGDIMSGSGAPCHDHVSVKVVQCNGFLLWNLPYAPGCSRGYCTAIQSHAELTCAAAPSPPHATGCEGALVYPGSCTLTCDEGYEPAGVAFSCIRAGAASSSTPVRIQGQARSLDFIDPGRLHHEDPDDPDSPWVLDCPPAPPPPPLCDTVNCGHSGTCVAATGKCDCPSGYGGTGTTSCTDPCSGDPCGSHGTCSRGATGTAHTCSCTGGWSGATCGTPPAPPPAPPRNCMSGCWASHCQESDNDCPDDHPSCDCCCSCLPGYTLQGTPPLTRCEADQRGVI